MNNSSRRGFTLIELLVVIAIIALLSTLATVALSSARARSRDAKRVADVKQIQNALDLYYNDANSYPASIVSGGSISYNGNTFMNAVPTAPTPVDGSCNSTTNTYTYASQNNNASYTLSYCLGAVAAEVPAGLNTATPSGIRN